MSAITIMLIILVALLAGMEGILDEFQFHQPLVAVYFNWFSFRTSK